MEKIVESVKTEKIKLFAKLKVILSGKVYSKKFSKLSHIPFTMDLSVKNGWVESWMSKKADSPYFKVYTKKIGNYRMWVAVATNTGRKYKILRH